MITIAPSRPSEAPPRPTRSHSGLVLATAAIVCAARALTGAEPLLWQALAGLFALIVVPVVLLNAKVNWPTSTKLHESLLYSLALVVLGLMVGGLAINYVLPLVGVLRPLDRLPVVIALSVALAGLGLWRRDRWRWRDGLSEENRTRTFVAIGWRGQLVLVTGAILVAGSVAGPIRLNNGASGAVTTAVLILAAVLIVAVFAWRRVLHESTIMATIYLLSLSLLFMTSLRGWFVTGHDIQREFRLFQLASSQGVWDLETFRSAYNACLSVTILPTIIESATGIPALYIFKVVVQLLFAFCPVLIYLISRRFAARSVAIIAAVYFVAFPTYFSDMPFLIRQEVAFFFLGVALLLITNASVPIRTRKIGFVVLGVGIILSHYSTTDVLLAVLVLSWMGSGAVRIVRKLIRARQTPHNRVAHDQPKVRNAGQRVVTLGVIVPLALLTYLWVGPLTGTGAVAQETATTTLNALMGKGDGEKSSDGSYSIFGGEKRSPEKLLSDYRTEQIDLTTGGREAGENYPLSEVNRYATPLVPAEELPPTTLGEYSDAAGVDVSTVNQMLRGGAPILLQLFIGIGFGLALFGRPRGFRVSPEFVSGAGASIFAIALHVLLPMVSVDYGVLRTFAQSLFWLAPFLAVGSIQIFCWLGRTWAVRAALSVAVLFFLSLTGVIPQVLGGYPPQLHLNNSGRYYDDYYLHAQDVSAMKWLQGRIAADKAPSIQYDKGGGFYELAGEARVDDDLFPIDVRKNSYAFMGYAATRKGEVPFYYGGDVGIYEYPIEFLDNNKSLLYSSDGARIYR